MAARDHALNTRDTPAPDAAGYGQPPKAAQFQKGKSGNPKGRPKNRHKQIPYDAVLGQMVTIREDGRKRRVTAAEAFILQLTQKGLAGDSAAARASLGAIEAARASRVSPDIAPVINIRIVGFGIDGALRPLGLAIKKFGADEARARWELNPWIVQSALDRFGDRELTLDEQHEVYANTRTPHKVKWPEWWESME